ncbi:MAG TPA: acyl-CoA dehydrogenase family protein [Myxococcota bacterium]|nr:acyl-CoA dehydrogenase family protein [Myxococcota bacterium]
MFEPSEVQAQLAEAVGQFCRDAIAPHAEEDDEHERFRPELMRAMGEQGLCGVATAEAWGGLGLGYLEYCTVLEEIAKVSPSYAVSVAVTGLPQIILSLFGDDAQRRRWLPGLASGQLLGAFALSEPGSGSDAASLRTTATRKGDRYVLEGTKYWITHGSYADVYVVMARTGGEGPRGVSAFLVPGDARGLSFGRKERKMGMRASPTMEVILEGVEVPADQRLGDEGIGFTVAMTALDSGRITIGATSVGIAQAALDCAGRYATQRRQFQTPIIDFQGVGFMLADMAVAIEGARLLVHKAAWLKDQGKPYSQIAAMAKVAATDAAMRVTTDAVQVLGGYGYCKDYPVERLMRDAKVMQIVEGTNQIQRLVISRHLRRTYGN